MVGDRVQKTQDLQRKTKEPESQLEQPALRKFEERIAFRGNCKQIRSKCISSYIILLQRCYHSNTFACEFRKENVIRDP